MSNFLTTSTEPKLYFKPWELLPEQEDQINRQREDVDVLIDQELDDFDQVRHRWQKEDTNGHAGHQDIVSTNEQDTSNGANHAAVSTIEPANDQDQDAVADQDTKLAVTNAIATESTEEEQTQEQAAEDADRHRKESIDDTGDIVVEADEDTVIY